MMYSKARTLAVLLVLPLLLVVSGCSDDDTPTAPPLPDTPSQAVIIVTARIGVITDSPVEGFRARITVPTTITESAGIGADITAIQMEFFEEVGAPEVVEVQQITGQEIIDRTGTNRVEGNSSREGLVPFDYNFPAMSGRLIYAFTDDLGNDLQATFLVDFGL